MATMRLIELLLALGLTAQHRGSFNGFASGFFDGQQSDSGSGETSLCPGGCMADCHAYDDPHMKTFDGIYYEMQQAGQFYLYHHNTDPIWVQGWFQSCGYNGAFCSCGVAVRYFGEVFIVDKCLHQSGQRANVVAKLGSGNQMTVLSFYAGYKVSLPNGLKVIVGSYGQGVGTIDLYVSTMADFGHISGLCGAYNGDSSDDFTWRTGETTNFGNSYPYAFADSWRVLDSENLFSGLILDNIVVCAQVSNTTSLPAGVTDGCLLNITPHDLVGDGVQPDSQTNDTGVGTQEGDPRTKRQTNIYPNDPWPAPWTYFSALSFCANYIGGSPSVQQCFNILPVSIDTQPALDGCARDIYLTGTTDFAGVAIQSVSISCKLQLEYYGLDSPTLLLNSCPFDCSNHGTCLSGACVCDQGWSGVDCSQDLSLTPAIIRSIPSVYNCPPVSYRSKCYSTLLIGGPFINSGSLSAAALIYPNNQQSPAQIQPVYINFISSGMVELLLRVPACSGIGRSGTVSLAITVTNDGNTYSNSWVEVINSWNIVPRTP